MVHATKYVPGNDHALLCIWCWKGFPAHNPCAMKSLQAHLWLWLWACLQAAAPQMVTGQQPCLGYA